MNITSIFKKILTPEQICSDPETLASYGKDWLELYEPKASTVLFPKSTTEVAEIVKACNEHAFALVPSGGRTGLSGGATAINGEIVLSLDRMNAMYEVSALDQTLRCQAGVPTEKVKSTALEHGLCFPVAFGSTGSSHIGGNIATNAGGIHVIRYGKTRAWVLGLTAVTGSGDILELNGPLYKNRTGYDLHQLLIGSEGTLAIITEVTLRLTQPPKPCVTVLCGVQNMTHSMSLFNSIRHQFPSLEAFEYLERNGLEKVLHGKNITDPFPEAYPIYLVLEVEEAHRDIREQLEEFLAEQLELENLAYVVMSQSTRQSKELMSLRELLPESLAATNVLYKNDVSVPISAISDFIDDLKSVIARSFKGAEVVLFGHLGDGNIHVNILKPPAQPTAEFKKLCDDKQDLIFETVSKYRGSISAEHGVGMLKRAYLHYSRSNKEIELMKAIKRVFDPAGILNPGKIFEL